MASPISVHGPGFSGTYSTLAKARANRQIQRGHGAIYVRLDLFTDLLQAAKVVVEDDGSEGVMGLWHRIYALRDVIGRVDGEVQDG